MLRLWGPDLYTSTKEKVPYIYVCVLCIEICSGQGCKGRPFGKKITLDREDAFDAGGLDIACPPPLLRSASFGAVENLDDSVAYKGPGGAQGGHQGPEGP